MIPALNPIGDGARLFVIAGDGMADLRPGRHAVAVRPVDGYDGEGMYANAYGTVHLCDVGEGGVIRAYGTAPAYRDYIARLTRDEFATHYPFKVTAVIEFLETSARNAVWGAVQQAREAA